MADILQTLSDSMAGAVETVGKSTVKVAARRRMPATGIVWSADGVIVTSHHGVEFEDNIKVGLPDGKTVTASFVGRDPGTDLAVLRADVSHLTAPTWAAAESVRVGHLALAVGRPGDDLQATLGVISALMPHKEENKYFAQTDVVMYPGFSGGPLVSASGEVIGLNSSGLMRGVSLTVQTPTIQYVVENLLKHGKMRRGFLGVGVQPARLSPSLAESLGQKSGAMIVSVESGSPAEKAELFMGDTIITLGSYKVGDLEDLLAALGSTQIGSTITAKIIRGGQVLELPVTIGERG
ncbi:MAG: S1C family serine protease [Chloroflexi bacterium]|nr:S1C family serine protease [Chloroflexota bacterium]MCC6892408.1 trypsin-like peptidase domain-containing protein [Anaerolineae bacterium]